MASIVTLVGESASVGAELEGFPLTVTTVSGVRVADEPELRTFIDLEVAVVRSAGLAEAISRAVERAGGW